MKMKNTFRRILIYILSALCCLLIGVGCDKSKEDAGNGFSGFLKGYRENIHLGESVIMEEFIDFVADSEYKVTLTLGEENKDYTDRAIWTPDTPGVWTVKYEVLSGENKGTYTCTVEVKVPTVQYQMSLDSRNTTFEKGDTIQFTPFIDSLNVFVESYYSTTFEMQSVLHDGVRTDLTEETEYTFAERGYYYFTFHITSQDGQTRKAIVETKVIQTDPAAKAFMETNKVQLYKYSVFDEELAVELDAGSHKSSFSNNDIGYVAYKGQYGEGDYVKFDFTGNNLPKVAFFCDQITQNLVDGNAGIYLSNGTLWNNGRDYVHYAEFSSLTAYGPLKVADADFRSNGGQVLHTTGEPANPAAISRRCLEEDTKYRYVVGFSDVDEAALTATYHALLINLDTYEIVFDYQGLCDLNGKNVTANYFKGSIVAYGSFGTPTLLDKVYPVVHANSVYEADPAANLKIASKSVRAGESVSTSDFIDEVGADEKFGYIAKADLTESDLFANDAFVPVNGTSFSFPAVGEYVVAYSKGGSIRPIAIPVHVYDGYSVESFEGDSVPSNVYLSGSGSVRFFAGITSSTATDGQKSLQVNYDKSADFKINFRSEYIDMIFTDDLTLAFSFDVRMDRPFEMMISNAPTKVGTEWQTVTVTKAEYEYWKEKCTIWAKGNSTDYAIILQPRTEAEGNVIYIDNIRAVKKVTAYISGTMTGTYDVESSSFAGATGLKLNGTTIPVDKFSVSGNVLSIDKAYLYQNALPENGLEVVTPTGTVTLRLGLVKENVSFEDKNMSSIVAGSEYFVPMIHEGNAADGNVKIGTNSGTSATATLYLQPEYLQMAFADSNVTCVAFDVWTPYPDFNKEGFLGNGNKLGTGANGWSTYIITRADYEWLCGANVNASCTHGHTKRAECPLFLYIQFRGGIENGVYRKMAEIYFDNFRAVYGNENVDVVLLASGQNGAVTLSLGGATAVDSVKVNGVRLAADKYQVASGTLSLAGDVFSAGRSLVEIKTATGYRLASVSVKQLPSTITTVVDFEDGEGVVLAYKGSHSVTVLDVDGNKVLGNQAVGSKTYDVYLEPLYLKTVFADASVTAIAFDVKASATLTASCGFLAQNGQMAGAPEGWTTYTITREQYTWLCGANVNASCTHGHAKRIDCPEYLYIRIQGSETLTYAYIDNLRPVKA